MEILLASILLLAAVTLVGHGIWVFLSWIYRAAGGSRDGTPRDPIAGRCPRCGLPLLGSDCDVCRWPASAEAAPRPRAALDAIGAQIERLGKLGILDEAACRRFAQALADERGRLLATAGVRLAESAAKAEEIIEAEVVPEPARPAPAIVPAGRTVEERAAAVAAHQRQTPEPVIERPAKPARAWTDYLAAFMEERNIRWGELVGGLLIVCGSIALVVSFWSAIAERPWMKFSLFGGVTAALFGVGFYSEHRWRLRTTSQGLLTIGCLLVPLNFLAIAALSSAPLSDGLVTIAGEILSAALFAVLVFYAGRILVRADEIGLMFGLLVPSLAQLLVRRFVDPSATAAMMAGLAAVPVVCYLAVNFWAWRRTARVLMPDERQVNALFKFLGMTSFAAVVPIALLLYRTGEPLEALRQLPALAGLLGLVPLCAGLLLWQNLAGRAALVGLRTAGTSVACGGALVTLAGIVIAWPEPSAMLPAALVEFAIFTFVAWRFGLPAAHVVAAPCLALAYLLGAHLVGGRIDFAGNGADKLARVLVSGETGALLAPLVLAYAAAAYFARWRVSRSSLALGGAAAGLAAVSVALLSWFGFGVAGDPFGAAWVYLIYAACFLAVAARHYHPAFSWLGSALLVAAVVQGIVFGYSQRLGLVHPEVTAILAYCTLSAAIAFGVRRFRAAVADSPLVNVAWNASLFVSLVAAVWLVWLVPADVAGLEAVHWGWMAAVWFAAALATGRLPVWTLFQIALVLAALFGVNARLEQHAWFAESPRPWLDPWTLQSVAIALVVLNLFWAAARIVCRRLVRARRLLASPWLSVDRVTTGALVALVVLMGICAAAPGTLQELSPLDATIATAAGVTASSTLSVRAVPPITHFALTHIPHEHAGDWGSWVLLAGLLILLAATFRDRVSSPWLACLFITAAVSCPLVAARFESQVAVASALRWSSAALLLAGSAPIWARGWIARQAERLGWRTLTGESRVVKEMIALVFVLSLFAPVAMAVAIGWQALERSAQTEILLRDSFVWSIIAGACVVLAAALWTTSRRLANAGVEAARSNWPWVAAALVLLLGTAPLLSLALYHVGMALKGSPILGPDPGSLFHRMGLAPSYAVPILMTALALVGFALRERASGFGLAGGLVFNAAATAAYLLAISKGGLTFDAVQWLRLAQLNAAVAALYTLAWVGIAAWDRRPSGWGERMALDFPTSTQAAIAPAITVLALGWAWSRLVQYPQGFPFGWYPVELELADVWGWLSFAAVCTSVVAVAIATRGRLGMLAASIFLVALAILAAGVAARWDQGDWLAYNTLFVGHAAIAVGLLAVAWYADRSSRTSVVESTDGGPVAARAGAMWVVVQAAVIVLLAFRELSANEWWSAGGFALVGVALAPALAWIYQRRRYLYLAAPWVNLAATLALSKLNWIPGDREFFFWNVVLLALPVPAWLLIELRTIRGRRFKPLVEAPPFHRVAARIATGALVLGVGAALFADWIGNYRPPPWPALDWMALAATLVAILACLWDVKGKDSVAMLYALGLVACAVLLDGFNLTQPWLLWTGTMVLAAFALATSYLWSRRRGLMAIATSLGVPRPPQTELAGLAWLVPANMVLVSAVVLLTFAVELTNREVGLRVLAAQATLAQVVSMALLARGDHRGILQLGALKLGAIGAVMFGWAWLEVGTTLTWLHALVVVAAATAGVAALYGLGLGKLLRDTSDWLAPARRITPWLAATSAAAIAAVLAIEILEFAQNGEVQIAWPAILVVAVTLGALSAAALAAAVLPGRDPLGLSERGRTLYVYGAEVILALLFVHMRVTLPWLFTGFFQQFWPLVVMAIAYLGVGVSELCRRRRQQVLAEPLENTGAMLPVLPVVGYWATNSSVDYSLLLLCVGVLYAGLSIARRSFGFGLLAALAANGGLWFFLGRQDGLEFLKHPQVWLIPPALCVLAAAYLNRRQLSEPQMTAVRYFTSMTIYLSSTADIFVIGVARAPWLPLVLAALSIVGILAGIMLRVRAFLFLGTSFLSLALFTIIWYAAEDLEQTWIWWATVVVLGILIVALFAIFEKKRQEILDAFERLKQWEA
ncbi:MAG: hypothetical protein WD063_03050 [Pirellulales bacterium]